jgi:hypothetical protein
MMDSKEESEENEPEPEELNPVATGRSRNPSYAGIRTLQKTLRPLYHLKAIDIRISSMCLVCR